MSGPTALQVTEIVLVALGALAHAHLAHSRSRVARELWFNTPLYLWNLAWSVWYGLTLVALNLETLEYNRFPGISMVLDVLKGCLLNLQTAFLLHGILRWNRRVGLPVWVVYVVPLLFIAVGMGPLVQQPGSSFLRNVDSLVIAYLGYDLVVCLLGALLLGWRTRPADVADQRIRKPLQKALLWMIPLLALALVAKLLMGVYVPGKYRWVLFFDTAHLMAPAALLLTAYWTNSVALDVTRTSVRRLVAFGIPFGLYLGMKLLWPRSEVDRVATWIAAALSSLAIFGPLSSMLLRRMLATANYNLQREVRTLEKLAARIGQWDGRESDVYAYAARSVGRILACRTRIVRGDDPVVLRLIELAERGIDAREVPQVYSLLHARSRAEILLWEELGARMLLPIWQANDKQRTLQVAIVMGGSRKVSRFPREMLVRLRALRGALQQYADSRVQLQRILAAERRVQEGERLAMLGLLSATTAHEIKNPLSAIRNVTTAALRDAPQGSILQQDLQVVIGEVDRLNHTVRRMLHVARDRDECENAVETVLAVAGLLAIDARQKDLRLETQVPEVAVPLALGENDLKAVLFNLVLNALQHAPRHSAIRIALDPIGPVLQVENDGEIPEEFRPRLFQLLATQGGTGLGLYISRQKVEASGGVLEHVPTPGRTVFRLRWMAPEKEFVRQTLDSGEHST